MLSNHLAAALRHLVRNKFYTAISVFGLAIGLWAALLTALILTNQFSYDHFIPGYSRIYMAMSWITPAGHSTLYFPSTNSFVGPELKRAFSEIEAVTRLALQPATLRRGPIEASEQIYWADPNVFDVLPLPTLAGDLKSALRRPDSIVLSKTMARKYFGRDAPLGETLLLDGTHPMTVSAVIEDLPVNDTHLQSGIFASGLAPWSYLAIQDAIPGNVKGSYVGLGINTYLKLAPGASAQRLLAAMPAMARTLWRSAPQGTTQELQLIRMDRLNSHPGLNPAFAGRAIIMLVLGTVTLLIACVNFVNLMTARSALRATEVAIRKVAGAQRQILVLQFLGESLSYVAVSVLIAFALTEWSLPYANAFLTTGATLEYWRDYSINGWVFLAAVLLGLIAGTYPAFLLSSFRPLDVLNGTTRHSHSATLARQILVTVQFAVLIGLLVSAGIVYEQRDFATHEALRVDTDQLLLIRSPCNRAFLTELQRLHGVRGTACTDAELLGGVLNVSFPKARNGVLQLLRVVGVESTFFKLYGIQTLAGRLPSDAPTAGRTYSVINETAARRLGFTSLNAAVGFPLIGLTQAGPPIVVSGVVPDFALNSVEQKIDATNYVVEADSRNFNLINVKLTGHDIPETLKEIDRLWIATGGKQPVTRFFLNDYLQTLYISILREAEAFGIFSLVAVLLACLGLLGLSALITERRTREIGIRKAMGADTRHIVRLLLWQFARPVLWASLIAWPVAGVFMNRWLHGFAYHTNLSLWLFVAAAAAAVLIGLLTVSVHSFMVARAKPVAALRYE